MPKTLASFVDQKALHTNLKSLDTQAGVRNEADSVCLPGTPLRFVLLEFLLHQGFQCCHVDVQKRQVY